MIHNEIKQIIMECKWTQCQLAILCFLIGFPKSSQSGDSNEEIPPLLIITFDGFRWDYITRTSSQNFQDFKETGVVATKGLKSVFPTSTLTNHWSIVTGLYAESHGIIANEFYDPVLKKTYVPLYKDKHVENDNQFYDTGVEPIWVSNQLHQGKTGSIMWWGAENTIMGVKPSYHMPYNLDIDDKAKIDKIIELFTSDEPINLGLVYFPEPDASGHKYGPDSDRVTEIIARADELLEYLLEELYRLGVLDNLNIILTSDHGLTSTSEDNLILLDEIVDPSLYTIVHYSPVAHIIPKKGKEGEVYKKLLASSKSKHFQVYEKNNIPERLHFKHNRRVPPIVAIADLHYSFITGMPSENFTSKGSNGYDNENEDMNPFFMARGPSFKQNVSVETFDLVDLYPLMCFLLQLTPNPNNGSLHVVSKFLVDFIEVATESSSLFLNIFLVTSCVILVLAVLLCRRRRYRRFWFKQLTPASWNKEGIVTIAWPITKPKLSISRSVQNAYSLPLLADLPGSDDEF